MRGYRSSFLKIYVRLLFCGVTAGLSGLSGIAQPLESKDIAVPIHLGLPHPRVAARAGNSQQEIRSLIEREPEYKILVEQAKISLAPYLEHVGKDPEWMASRLQMYWSSHATEVYNRGDVFDHTEGHAPVATVRYPGSRNPVSAYKAPPLEEIPPYEDDTRGVYLINTSLPNHPLEWAVPAKTGRVIDGINNEILHKAETAARLAWITGDEEYARFAFTIFDTYMRGMYYRKEPVDLNHGHSQTIYGMSTFEVIQEGILPVLASTYDFLHDYIARTHPDELPLYADAFRKWIDVTIHNGVPFNNWDLIEARFTAAVALVLEDDSAYNDGRGTQYYLNQILNEDSTRQWSLRRLAGRGFDPSTAIWFESPGYSMNVVDDFISLINDLDGALGTDLLEKFPVVRKAAWSMAQYAFPNGLTVSWGDSHYGQFPTRAARKMVINARMHHRRDQEVEFTGLIRLFETLHDKINAGSKNDLQTHDDAGGLEELFDRRNLTLNSSIPPIKLSGLLTATFSAPSVSYFVQRNGFDSATGLMISEAGSLGNHQHANGITMELYGEGLPLAPDSGIGTNYFEADHSDYYSQFPAHNTVVVDGISSYPAMKSHHGFTVNAAFPPSGEISDSKVPVTFSDVSFLEPETNADQRRVMSIVRTSPESGYYVDVFRSRRRDDKDLKHDWFFHGLGQSVEIMNAAGKVLPQLPTEKLTFADEELGAYDYLWDKHAVAQAEVYRAAYRLQVPGRSELQLQLWMIGERKRELFSVLAPPARSLRDTVPPAVGALPLHTLVLRQSGEAWRHPFVSIIEPASAEHPATVASVRMLPATSEDAIILRVEGIKGDHQLIFNADCERNLQAGNDVFRGTYGLVSEFAGGELLFIGEGTKISHGAFELEYREGRGSGFVRRDGAHWQLQLSAPAKITIPAAAGTPVLHLATISFMAHMVTYGGQRLAEFSLPALSWSEGELSGR